MLLSTDINVLNTKISKRVSDSSCHTSLLKNGVQILMDQKNDRVCFSEFWYLLVLHPVQAAGPGPRSPQNCALPSQHDNSLDHWQPENSKCKRRQKLLNCGWLRFCIPAAQRTSSARGVRGACMVGFVCFVFAPKQHRELKRVRRLTSTACNGLRRNGSAKHSSVMALWKEYRGGAENFKRSQQNLPWLESTRQSHGSA